MITFTEQQKRKPRYKLGSQLDLLDSDKFEWNLVLLDDRGINAVAYVPLGTHPIHHPIVKEARELVKLLNNEA
jgi:hypothetical protein